jgi:Ca2+-transporting ATPase
MDLGGESAITIAFLTLAFAQLWHTLNMHDPGSGLMVNEITRNPSVWASLGLCAGLLLAAVYIPGLQSVMGTTGIGAEGWALVLSASLVVLVVGRIKTLIEGRAQ